MKTSIKTLAGAFLLALTVSTLSPASASDDKHNKSNQAFAAAMFPAANASKLWLCLEKYQTENRVQLTLVNEKGDVLYDEIVSGKNSKRKTFRQQFDMNQLGDGNYTFRISAGSQTEEVTFKLATPNLEDTTPTRLVAIK